MQKMQKFPLPKTKMMKKYANKFMAATMAAAMMVSMGGMSVMAADDTKNTTVKYTVNQSYVWSVPTKIDFTSAANSTVTANAETGDTQKVKVTKNVIAEGSKLKITAKGSGENNAFTIVPSGKSHTLTYTINVGTSNAALTSGGEVLSVEAGTDTGETALTFKLSKDTVEQAGDYTGTVTYTAAVVNAK